MSRDCIYDVIINIKVFRNPQKIDAGGPEKQCILLVWPYSYFYAFLQVIYASCSVKGVYLEYLQEKGRMCTKCNELRFVYEIKKGLQLDTSQFLTGRDQMNQDSKP